MAAEAHNPQRPRCVVFRVDASASIGIGHLMRCVTLGRALQARGWAVHFIRRRFADAAPLPAGVTFQQHWLPAPPAEAAWGAGSPPPHAGWLGVRWETDAAQSAEVLQGVGAPVDWLVVDHYALEAGWEQALSRYADHLLVIDDLADRHHRCDLLLDQNGVNDAQAYAPWVSDSTRILAGPHYALLRPEFPARRAQAHARRRSGPVERLLVAFGGTDPANATGLALEALSSLSSLPALDVVLGGQAPHLEAIRRRCEAWPGECRLHVDTDAMAELMLNAELALGAPGTTSWERCCLGLPTLLLITADNQVRVGQMLESVGAARLLGRAQQVEADALADVIANMSEDAAGRAAMSAAAFAVCDGSGIARVLEALER